MMGLIGLFFIGFICFMDGIVLWIASWMIKDKEWAWATLILFMAFLISLYIPLLVMWP